MPSIREEDLKKHIREGSFSRLYFIYGDEGFLKKRYVDQILNTAVNGPMRDFNLHRFESGADWTEIASAVEAMPVMGGRTCVVARDTALDSVPPAQLHELICDLPESCVLVFWQDASEINVKKSAKWRSAIAEISKYGDVLELPLRDSPALIKILRDGADKRGCGLSAPAAGYLVSRCGSELSILLSELEKLTGYVRTGEITREHIDEICVKTVDASAFDLSKAIVKNDCGRAFSIIDELFAQRQEPVAILGALISAYVDMYRAKVASACGIGNAGVSAKFDYRGKDFRLKYAASDGARMSIPQLRGCLEELAEADRALKSTRAEPRQTLEVMIIKMMELSR